MFTWKNFSAYEFCQKPPPPSPNIFLSSSAAETRRKIYFANGLLGIFTLFFSFYHLTSIDNWGEWRMVSCCFFRQLPGAEIVPYYSRLNISERTSAPMLLCYVHFQLFRNFSWIFSIVSRYEDCLPTARGKNWRLSLFPLITAKTGFTEKFPHESYANGVHGKLQWHSEGFHATLT